MATINGFNRNMGYNRMMWTDEKYRKFVKTEVHLRNGYYVTILSYQNRYDSSLRRSVWLRVMGLMETWTLIK